MDDFKEILGLEEARALVLDMRSNVDALAGVWRSPKQLLSRGPAIINDLAGSIGVEWFTAPYHQATGFVMERIRRMADMGSASGMGAIALVGQFAQFVSKFAAWVEGEFADAAEQTAVNYAAAQAYLMSWVPMQGTDTFTVSMLPGFNAHGNTPDSGGFYLFVRPGQGEKNDRSDFYGDSMGSPYNWILQVAGLDIITDDEAESTLLSGGCQDNTELLSGGTCSANPGGRQVYWPVLFPLYSPHRLWGWGSRFGRPVSLIATAANTLTTLTPQHIAQREHLVDRAETVLHAVVKSVHPWTLLTPDGWVQRPDHAAPAWPRFSLADANQGWARIRAFRQTRRALKRVRRDAPYIVPGWALNLMDANPDFDDVT